MMLGQVFSETLCNWESIPCFQTHQIRICSRCFKCNRMQSRIQLCFFCKTFDGQNPYTQNTACSKILDGWKGSANFFVKSNIDEPSTVLEAVPSAAWYARCSLEAIVIMWKRRCTAGHWIAVIHQWIGLWTDTGGLYDAVRIVRPRFLKAKHWRTTPLS